MTYVWIGFASAVLLVVGLAFYYGRKSGREAQRVGDLQRNADVRAKQLQEANKPRDIDAVVKAARDGTF